MLLKNIKHLQEVLIQVLFLVSIQSTNARNLQLAIRMNRLCTHPSTCLSKILEKKLKMQIWKTSKSRILHQTVDVDILRLESLIQLRNKTRLNQPYFSNKKMGQKKWPQTATEFLQGPYSHCDPLRQLLIAALSPGHTSQHMANSFHNPFPTAGCPLVESKKPLAMSKFKPCSWRAENSWSI